MEGACDNEIFKMQIEEILFPALQGTECVQVYLAQGNQVGNYVCKDGKLLSHLEQYITFLCTREIENVLNKGKQNNNVPTQDITEGTGGTGGFSNFISRQ